MIQAIGLTSLPRRHQLKPTVDDLTFEARPGRVTVLLGPRGSGKTTALRLMLQLQPGRGIALFRGRPVQRIIHLTREVGVLLGDAPGHPARTARGHLRMLAAAAGVPVGRADDVLDVVGLSGLADQRIGELSRGMDRRLAVACALLGDPHTLVMDEPARDLSPRETSWLYSLLRGYAKEGGTVLVTSRRADEAADLADRVVSVDSGCLVADQEVADFVRTRLRPRVAVRTPHAERLVAVLTEEARRAGPKGRDGGPLKVVREDGNHLSVYGSSCAEVGEYAYRHGILVHQLTDESGDAGDAQAPVPLVRADGRRAERSPTGLTGAGHTSPALDSLAERASAEAEMTTAERGAEPGEEAAQVSGGAVVGPDAQGAAGAGAAATAGKSADDDGTATTQELPSSATSEATASTVTETSSEAESSPLQSHEPEIPTTATSPVMCPAATSHSDSPAEPEPAAHVPESVRDSETLPALVAVTASAAGGRFADDASSTNVPSTNASSGVEASATVPGAEPALGHGPSAGAESRPSRSAAESDAPAHVEPEAGADSRPEPSPAPQTSPDDPTVPISYTPLADIDPPPREAAAPSTATATETASANSSARPTTETAATGPSSPPSAWSPSRPPVRPAAELPPPLHAVARPGPVAPLSYELRRLSGVRTTWITAVVAVSAALCLSLVLARTGMGLPPASRSTVAPAVRLLAGWPSGSVFLLPPVALAVGLLGALSFGEEFRYAAPAPARAAVPHRLSLVAAKLAVSAALSVVLSLVVAVLNAMALTLFFGTDVFASASSNDPDSSSGSLLADAGGSVGGTPWQLHAAAILAFTVGCGWTGLLAAGVFRTAAAGTAVVLAVPLLVSPALHRLFSGSDGRSLDGLPDRLEAALLVPWPPGAERWVSAAVELASQPAGPALGLSLVALSFAYLVSSVRSRAR
ncbi:ATP-binding cassette domain-containing protein [Streptomyces ovatisporus]|uniref:ATP-binding cassette domain-containing protein n=1 Tax=Streptomyces ovatisporus TaxID=1128682 RepID=A0ABV9AER7_9ACTN